MTPPPLLSEESIITNERLRILSWGYYISGGTGAFFACFLLFYAAMFGAMSFMPEWERGAQSTQHSEAQPPQDDSHLDKKTSARSSGPPLIFFRIIAGGMVGATVLGWILAGLTFYAGRCIQGRKHRWFIYVMAGYKMIWIPYGTLLGVCTFIVVNSQEASRQFEGKRGPASAF